ncbi:hypothetical protein Dda_9100 [Drechslerella dactyloides]|uniref:Uncharacterized protein n=1 Tax=Drechslerella dactyloides TaxID=74499 RepID=A0AAD6IR08_DREDA|nr:hypothetical protein Dda_9100 [Drechslerella dactyloides]
MKPYCGLSPDLLSAAFHASKMWTLRALPEVIYYRLQRTGPPPFFRTWEVSSTINVYDKRASRTSERATPPPHPNKKSSYITT